ncbi:MAG: histone deacetylase [Deltaproteobacteria bacterium]|jgi:acetoin utilization deacetylase AcuC-like enzyme|nr:histone deacetylase [Deltaproteobacteria bacterium]
MTEKMTENANEEIGLGLIFFPAYDWAISPRHPEREERLLYTHDQLREDGVFDHSRIREFRPVPAEAEDAGRAHFFPLGLETVASLPHFIAAGGAIRAGELVAEKKVKKAFALVRPPGHHAGKVVHGGRGFCNINNEAIMVESLRAKYGYRRIAIVDTDCHHGDGSQDVFWYDPDLLFISLHQDGRTLYPGSGAFTELGGPRSWGATVNIPLPPETGDEGFLLSVREIVRPILDEWKPELVVNSAGQDNHFSDPITNMKITARGYAEMSRLIDPDIAVLEGGYAIQGALPYTNLGIILSMAGLDWSGLREPLPPGGAPRTRGEVLDYVKKVAEFIHQSREEPPKEALTGSVLKNGYFVRRKSIPYDSHPADPQTQRNWPSYFTENRTEYLRDCPDCPGVVVFRSSSEVAPEKVFAWLPPNPCEKCREVKEAVDQKGVFPPA